MTATTFTTPAAIAIYQATTLKTAIRLYAKTGMQVNRAYTPTAMLKTAAKITGQTFKRGQYEQAAKALEDWVEGQRG